MYDSKTVIDFIESRFPSLGDELHDELCEGLLHIQIAKFSRLAKDAIDRSDREQWTKVTTTFLDIWGDCTPDVENALNVSFLEHLYFTDGKTNRSWAYSAMPERMRIAWDEMDAYNREIHGG